MKIAGIPEANRCFQEFFIYPSSGGICWCSSSYASSTFSNSLGFTRGRQLPSIAHAFSPSYGSIRELGCGFPQGGRLRTVVECFCTLPTVRRRAWAGDFDGDCLSIRKRGRSRSARVAGCRATVRANWWTRSRSVLRAFLITNILLHTKSREGYFQNFFVRRSLRIFPLYFTALGVCLWLLPILSSTTAFDLPRANQAYLWTYLTNVRMAWLNSWCFGPLDHFWSLAVEEHFYLVWPVVVFCLSPKALLRISVAAILLVGVARTIAATNPAFDLAMDVLTIFRLDALCYGATLAVLMNQGLSSDRMEVIAKRALPVLFTLALMVALLGRSLLGLPNSLCPAIWTLLLGFLLTRHSKHWISRIANHKLLRWLGKYSYGMYVVQLPLLSILTPTLMIHSLSALTNNRVLSNIAFVPIMFAITMLLGFLTYHLLEKHFLRLKRRWE
jgi:peptidoglycan/LPS O-acetylase OafA/YrhL